MPHHECLSCTNDCIFSCTLYASRLGAVITVHASPPTASVADLAVNPPVGIGLPGLSPGLMGAV